MLGLYLKNYRKKHRIFAISVAAFLGITKGYYSQIEHNKSVPMETYLIQRIMELVKNDIFIYNQIKDFYIAKKKEEFEEFKKLFD